MTTRIPLDAPSQINDAVLIKLSLVRLRDSYESIC
jgi:hypothetical protein